MMIAILACVMFSEVDIDHPQSRYKQELRLVNTGLMSYLSADTNPSRWSDYLVYIQYLISR